MAWPLLVYMGALAAFVASSLAIVGIIGTAGASLFPFIMPSSTDLRSNLTLWDSVSSQLTLIIGYTSRAYKVMPGKVTAASIRENEHAAH